MLQSQKVGQVVFENLSSDVKRMVDTVIKTFGALHFAHNNAGIEGERATIEECTEDNFDHVIQVI